MLGRVDAEVRRAAPEYRRISCVDTGHMAVPDSPRSSRHRVKSPPSSVGGRLPAFRGVVLPGELRVRGACATTP